MAHARQELMRYNLKIPATTGPCSAMVVKALVLPRISNIEDHANACIVVRHGRQRIEVLQAAEMDKKKMDKDKEVDMAKVLTTKTSSWRFQKSMLQGSLSPDSC